MSKMGLEERALRHADKFFDTEDKWYPGNRSAPICVGLKLLHYYNRHNPESYQGTSAFQWANKVMGVLSVIKWNDALPSFKAMKSALKARIRHYKGLRT